MNIKLYREHGAQNSVPVFDAFEKGALSNGDTIVSSYEEADCVVIWSVLFQGRMQGNKAVWERAQAENKPVVVLEIGALRRNITWRMGINGINRNAQWPVFEKIDTSTSIDLLPWQDNSKEFVTIATQRPDSLQWVGMPPVDQWLETVIKQVKKYSQRPIVIRPHPRDKITNWEKVHYFNPDVFFDMPKPTGNHDHVNFGDILNRTHILINYCTSPAIEAVIKGIPVIVGEPSMAWDMTTEYKNIENPYKAVDLLRVKWLEKLYQTEFTVEEIEGGRPWQKLRVFV